MAKCNCCGREMLTANGCLYRRVVVKGAHKETFKRIKVGDPGDWYEWSDIPMKAVSRIESGRKVLWKNPIFEETKK